MAIDDVGIGHREFGIVISREFHVEFQGREEILVGRVPWDGHGEVGGS